MQLHNVQPRTKRKKSNRVGRGGTRGKTSGRGTKGQKARAGRKLRPEIRDMIKRIPKLRGRGKNSNKSIQADTVPVNLHEINARVTDGMTLTDVELLSLGLISKKSGKMPKVKILGTGAITKKISISGMKVSESAKIKIEKAGGSVIA